jgi:hypothetical protein
LLTLPLGYLAAVLLSGACCSLATQQALASQLPPAATMASSPSQTAPAVPLSASTSEILASQAIPSASVVSSSSAALPAAAEASSSSSSSFSSSAAYPLFPSAGRLIGYGDLVIMQLVRRLPGLRADALLAGDLS